MIIVNADLADIQELAPWVRLIFILGVIAVAETLLAWGLLFSILAKGPV